MLLFALLLVGCGGDPVDGGISGTVSLAPDLAERADPDDTVFLFARMPEGPPMPLAVQRLQVRDLPASFVLDDSHAMTEMRLSQAERVLIVARVSKSGMAGAQPGDLEGRSQVVAPGTAGLEIVIDQAL
ncbi:hypothetical protein HUS23_11885 [Ectothiorhodospiraceae bacterium 2226]|nr:hypothetical protein HUS23_11885 [Ectothiorhodospiraceae bacterium 2226]